MIDALAIAVILPVSLGAAFVLQWAVLKGLFALFLKDKRK